MYKNKYFIKNLHKNAFISIIIIYYYACVYVFHMPASLQNSMANKIICSD